MSKAAELRHPPPPLVTSLKEELDRLTERQDAIETDLDRLVTEKKSNAEDIESIKVLLANRGYQLGEHIDASDEPDSHVADDDVDHDAVDEIEHAPDDEAPKETATTRQAILALLSSEKRDFSVREIIQRLPNFGSSAQEVTVRSYVVRMRKANQIVHGATRGTWRVPADVTDFARETLQQRRHLVAHAPEELPGITSAENKEVAG